MGVAVTREQVCGVIAAVSVLTDVPAKLITRVKGRSTRKVSRARWMVWRELRRAGMSLPEAGAATGGHDHTSVLAGVRKLGQEEILVRGVPLLAWARMKPWELARGRLVADGAGL